MTIETGDWTGSLRGSFLEEFCGTIRDIPIGQLQKYPPPKRNGLPFGHEARIIRRFWSGRSSLLDPSGLSSAYLALATCRERLHYKAFVLGQALDRNAWQDILGPLTLSRWYDALLLEEMENRKLCCRFRVLAAYGIILVVDHEETSSPNHVHIGQDSLNFLEFISQRQRVASGRLLDVGTGSGAILLSMTSGYDEALGIDINPRAVTLARVNAAINGCSCAIETKDALTFGPGDGTFDLVTWNAPFMYFPESEQDRCVDGYGGHFGIALTLDFLERLPDMLTSVGVSYILTSAPILDTGENRLETELTGKVERLGLQITAHVLQRFWTPALREFHRNNGVIRFESVILEISLGPGSLRRCEPHWTGRVTDLTRSWLYERGAFREES